jgi:hypothetical protein
LALTADTITMRFHMIKIFVGLAFVSGCSETNISGGSKKDIFVGSSKPKNCDNTGASTEAVLLTDSFSSSPVKQEIVYEVSLVDCEGERIKVNDLPVSFDINLRFTNQNQNQSDEIADLNYRFESIDGKRLSEGVMSIMRGSDLFGKVSEDYFHWKTDSVSNVEESKKIKFIVVISGYQTSTFKNLPTHSVDTFLSIGQARPLRKEIKFIP